MAERLSRWLTQRQSLFRPIHARKRLDIPWRAILHTLSNFLFCLTPPASTTLPALETSWAPQQALVTLTVRSALDLLLTTLALPAGSEIILSAITIPDMARIISLHNLVPVPVDVQDDATVSPASVAALLTPKTKAILVAQLFGARHDLQDIAALARREGVLFIEDCAQAFVGREWTGSPCADVSLFSFGPIKTATALGGALVTVRRPELLGKMREVQARYPRQSEGVFAKRALKYAVLKAVADSKWLYGVFVAGLVVMGWDVHGTITRLGRSLRPGDIRAQIRVQPSAALLDLLMYRLQSFDPRGLERRRERVKSLVGRLPGEVHPVRFEKQQHHYWICPIRVKSRGGVISGLWREGFDSADGGTSLCVVGAGGGGVDVNGEKRPKMAEDMMRRVVYLPIDHEFDDHELERLAKVLAESARW